MLLPCQPMGCVVLSVSIEWITVRNRMTAFLSIRAILHVIVFEKDCTSRFHTE